MDNCHWKRSCFTIVVCRQPGGQPVAKKNGLKNRGSDRPFDHCIFPSPIIQLQSFGARPPSARRNIHSILHRKEGHSKVMYELSSILWMTWPLRVAVCISPYARYAYSDGVTNSRLSKQLLDLFFTVFRNATCFALRAHTEKGTTRTTKVGGS